MKVTCRPDRDGRMVFYVPDVESLEDYRAVIENATKAMSGRLMDSVSGPGGIASFARFGRRVVIFDLDDMLGMTYRVTDPTDHTFGQEIAQAIEAQPSRS